MTKSKPINKPGNKKVTFSLKAPRAKEVILIGNFNNWNLKKHPMKLNGDGLWSRSIMLKPGDYEYKFLIDGQWQTDPLNGKTCLNHFGTLNYILTL